MHTLSLVFVMHGETLMSSDEKNGDTPDTRLQFLSSILEFKHTGDSAIRYNRKISIQLRLICACKRFESLIFTLLIDCIQEIQSGGGRFGNSTF